MGVNDFISKTARGANRHSTKEPETTEGRRESTQGQPLHSRHPRQSRRDSGQAARGGYARASRRQTTQPNLDEVEASSAFWIKRSRSKNDLGDEPKNFVDGPIFTGIIMAGICVNALQMGLELQLKDDPYKMIWKVMEHFFTAFFLFEMCIKIMVLGPCGYFKDKMNWLDCIVVVSAVVENWILKVFLNDDASSLGFLGILRLVRLSRILKLLRAKRELMLLLEGIISSIRSMFWLSILLCILVYTCGICFVLFIGDSDVYDDDDFDNKHYFGDLVAACVTGLNLALLADWEDVIRPIAKKQPWFAIGLCAYVAISCFGIMNAIIGVIVTRTAEASEANKEEDLLNYRMNQMDVVENIKEIIYSIDTSGDGCVSKDEINAAGNNEELRAILDEVELPYAFTLDDLHTLLDKDGDGELSAAEFFVGMRRLVFSNDFQRECVLVHAVQQVKRKIFEMREEMHEEFEKVTKRFLSKLDLKAEAILQAVAASRTAENMQGSVNNAEEPKESYEVQSRKDTILTSQGRKPEARQIREESLPDAGHGRPNANRKELTLSPLSQNEIVPSNQGDIPNYGQQTAQVKVKNDRLDNVQLPGSPVRDPERPQNPKTPPPMLPINENEDGHSFAPEMSSPGLSPLRDAAHQGLQDKIRDLEMTIQRLTDENRILQEQATVQSTASSPDHQRHPATETPEKLTTLGNSPGNQRPVGRRKKGAFGDVGRPPNESLL